MDQRGLLTAQPVPTAETTVVHKKRFSDRTWRENHGTMSHTGGLVNDQRKATEI